MTQVAYFKQKLFPFFDLQLKDGGLAPERDEARLWKTLQDNALSELIREKKPDVKMKKRRRKKDKPIEEKW